MRLLLDEHYSPAIAESLRARGHDVVAVAARPDLIGADDRTIFARSATERRALVTENWADFAPILADPATSGHYGVIFTSARALPRSRASSGRFVDVVDAFLRANEPDEALRDTTRWLP